MDNFVKDVKVIVCSNGAAAGVTQVNSAIVDAFGFDEVVFMASVGAVTAGSVMALQMQDSNDNAATNMANIGGNAAVTDSGGATSNSVMIVDAVNVQKRYVRATFAPTVQNAVLNQIICVLRRAKSMPVTQPASVSATSLFNATA